MKHADKDPTGTLENFSEMDTDSILFIACHDFLRVAKGQPIEMQVFEAWWFATAHVKVSEAPLRAQETIRRCIRRFQASDQAIDKSAKRWDLRLSTKHHSTPISLWQLRKRCAFQ
jgi:hypothetical protein